VTNAKPDDFEDQDLLLQHDQWFIGIVVTCQKQVVDVRERRGQAQWLMSQFHQDLECFLRWVHCTKLLAFIAQVSAVHKYLHLKIIKYIVDSPGIPIGFAQVIEPCIQR
jgi:hypothetical protein